MANRELSGDKDLLDRSLDSLRSTYTSSLITPRGLALVYLVALTIAEVLTTLIEPRVGMFLHGLIFIALLAHANFLPRGRQRSFLLALSLAPLIRLVSLSMPLPDFPFVYWYLIVGAPLVIAAIFAMRLTKINTGMVGLKWHKLPWQLVVGAAGIGIGLIEYYILRPDPLVAEFNWRQMLLPAIILLLFTGFLEEFIFRGLMQYNSARTLGRFGLFFVAAIFAVLHIGYRSILDVIFVFIVAVFFSLVVQRTGSLLGVTLAHGITNISLFLIFPFLIARPVSPPENLTEVTIPQQTVFQGASTPTAKVVGPALWAPNQNSIQTKTPNIPPTASSTPEPSPTPSETPIPATPSPTAIICAHPVKWISYAVKSGESLATIGRVYGLTAYQLRIANCLPDGSELDAGQVIYVPSATATIAPTTRPSATPLPPPTSTPRPTRPPATNTSIPTIAPTRTPTKVPTQPPPSSTPREVPPTSAPTIFPTITQTDVPPSNTPTLPPDTATPPPPPTNTPISLPPTSPPPPTSVPPTPTSTMTPTEN
jgi:membrane protease YdiL (CAAX protease family)